MKKIRYGNDIPIEWSINRNDKPEDFTGKTLRLTMIGTSGTTEVTDYTIDGNVLRWMFWGKDQHKPSTYHFCLIENGGEEGMFTIDTCDVLGLVGRSCAADDCDGPFTMQVTSNIDDKGVTCSSVITVPANGLSAYEIAVRHGFEGTEEEWLESLKGADGKTPVLKSGTTTTLDAGQSATASLVRNGEDESGNPKYKVDFGIPRGEPFTYDDFTPEQIEEIKKPAVDAAAAAKTAADAATEAAANADNAAKTATEAASSANDAADGAGQAAVDAGLAKTAAEEAAERATEAAAAAGSAAEVANAAAQAANQAVESIEESLSVKQDKTDESLQTTDKTIIGAINELLSSGNVSGEVIAQALAELYARVMGLGSVVDNMGHLRARRLTLDNFPEICGAPMYSSGEGAPSVPPEVPFQEYYDITNKKFYKAQGELPDTPTTANWIAIN